MELGTSTVDTYQWNLSAALIKIVRGTIRLVIKCCLHHFESDQIYMFTRSSLHFTIIWFFIFLPFQYPSIEVYPMHIWNATSRSLWELFQRGCKWYLYWTILTFQFVSLVLSMRYVFLHGKFESLFSNRQRCAGLKKMDSWGDISHRIACIVKVWVCQVNFKAHGINKPCMVHFS